MRIKILIIIFLCIIAESIFLTYPATLLAITIVSIFAQEDATLLAFIGGLVLDLFSLRLLGVDSLYFLSLIYLGTRYKKKIYGGTILFRFLYLLLSFTVYNLLFYKNLDLTSFGVTIVLGAVVLLLIPRFFPQASEQRLAV